ncbi:MAG: DUF1697 domain-containing protein [Candidatus Saccharimonadales bacterium]
MNTYIAFLRGINVGGNNMLKMQDLKDCLEKNGYSNVRTYIQSGNVILDSSKGHAAVVTDLKALIKKEFAMDLGVAVFTDKEWVKVVKDAPKDWGKDPTIWRHNILILLEPYDMKQAMKDFGFPKPDIEALTEGDGVMYQSGSIADRGRTTYSKIVGKPIYKQLTIRNYNTALKIATLFQD